MLISHRTIAIAALLTLPLLAGAQGLGIKGGLSYGSTPNTNGALPGTLSSHSGFAIGVSVEGGSIIGLGIEGLYAQRGYSSTVAGSSRELAYLDVPAYVKLTLPLPALAPFAYAGPQLSYELKCESGGVTCPSGRTKLTYAGVIGAGVRLGVLGGISLEGRYVYGLNDLKMDTVSNTDSYKTRSFMLLAGFGF